MEKDERQYKPFPQRPAHYEDAYADTPDWWGKCPDCPECGATMGYSYSKNEFKCPECGRLMDIDEAIAIRDEERDAEADEIPFVCRTCGGPYPDCRTSCKMFDD